jgi:hypothetical protein
MMCLGSTFFPVCVVRLQLYLYWFHNKAFHMSGFLGRHTGVVELNMVSQFMLCLATVDFSG